MSTEYKVSLLFSAPKTQALDQLNRQLGEIDKKSRNIGGGDPFKDIDRGAKGATGSVAALTRALGPLLAAYAGFSALKGIFTAGAEIEGQIRSIKVLTGSLATAKDIIKELQDYGAVTPFTSSELIETAKRLKAFGVETQSVVDTTKRLGDIAGATGTDLAGLATAYGQVQAKGRLQGEELLQFQERGVALGAELTKMYGDKFPKALEKGQISAKAVEVALARLTSEGGTYFGGAIAQADTLSGKLSTLQDSFQRLAANIGTALAPVFKWVIDNLNTILEKINDTLSNGGKLRQREFQAQEQANREMQQKFGKFATIPGRANRDEALAFAEKRRLEILKQKRAELSGPPKAQAQADLSTPPLTAGKDAEDNEKKIRDLREDTIKRITELEKDGAREVAQLNKDLLKDVEDAKKRAIERGAELQKGLINEERELRRKVEDANAKLKLQQDIGGLTGNSGEIEAKKRVLEFEASYNQKERDLDRTAEDNKRTRALTLEKFKLDTAKDIGEINKKYVENYGKIQENYAINSAKILVTAAENMGKIIEAAAMNAASAMSSGGAGGGAGLSGSGVDQAKALLREFEGFREQPYWDVNAYRSGYGSDTVTSASGAVSRVQAGVGTTKEAAERDLTRRVNDLFSQLGVSFGDAFKGLPAAAQAAIASVYYNYGKIPSGVAAALKAGDLKKLGGAVGALGGDDGGINRARRTREADLIRGAKVGGATGIGSITTIPGVTDAKGRPLQLESAAAAAFQQMVKDSGGVVTGKDVTSAYRNREQNRRVGGAEGSLHTKGLALDVHGASGEWIRQKGGMYGWKPNDYKGSHGGHYEFVGGGMTTGGTPAAMVTPQLKPLPPRLGPQAGFDPSPFERNFENRAKGLEGLERDLAGTEKAAERQQFLNQESKLVTDINEAMREQVKTGEQDLKQTETRLGYLRDGINPALADGFAELDRQADANRALLDSQIGIYEARLADANLSKDLIPVYEQLLALAQGQKDALSGTVAARRNQLVQADAAKKDPQNILTQEVADRQEKLDTLMNPANQLITAADSIGDAFGQAFQDIASGSMTAGEALSQMFSNIASSFLKMATDMLAQQAALSILKLFMGGGGGAGAGAGGSGFLTGGLFDTAFSFAGGGFTGNGPRSGGVDGQGGFPAILHPRESVIDHYEASRAALAEGASALQGSGGSSDALFADTRRAIGGSVAGGTVSTSTAMSQNQTVLTNSNQILRERMVEQQNAAAAQQRSEPIDVRIDAYDPAGAGLATLAQVQAVASSTSQRTQQEMLRRMRNDPSFRRGQGL